MSLTTIFGTRSSPAFRSRGSTALPGGRAPAARQNPSTRVGASTVPIPGGHIVRADPRPTDPAPITPSTTSRLPARLPHARTSLTTRTRVRDSARTMPSSPTPRLTAQLPNARTSLTTRPSTRTHVRNPAPPTPNSPTPRLTARLPRTRAALTTRADTRPSDTTHIRQPPSSPTPRLTARLPRTRTALTTSGARTTYPAGRATTRRARTTSRTTPASNRSTATARRPTSRPGTTATRRSSTGPAPLGTARPALPSRLCPSRRAAFLPTQFVALASGQATLVAGARHAVTVPTSLPSGPAT